MTRRPPVTESAIIERDQRYVADAIKIRYTPFVLARGEGARLFRRGGQLLPRLHVTVGRGQSRLQRSDRARRHRRTTRTKPMLGARLDHQRTGRIAGRAVGRVPQALPDESLVWPLRFRRKRGGPTAAAQGDRQAQNRLVIGSWHGTTDATMALSGFAGFNDRFGGSNIVKIPYPDPYRPPFPVHPDLSKLTNASATWKTSSSQPFARPTMWPRFSSKGVQADSGDIVPPDDFLPQVARPLRPVSAFCW